MFCSQFDTNLAPIPWTKYFEKGFGAFFALLLLSDITPLCVVVGGSEKGGGLGHFLIIIK